VCHLVILDDLRFAAAGEARIEGTELLNQHERRGTGWNRISTSTDNWRVLA